MGDAVHGEEEPSTTPLTDAFVAALTPAARAFFATEPNIEAWLAAGVADAQTAWPDFAIASEVFVHYLASRLPTQDAASIYRQLHVTDLYIACACAQKDPRALAAFETRYFPQIDRALARLKIARTVADDLKGTLREKLFFAQDDGPVVIEQYGGRGGLGSWVRSVGIRMAMRSVRKEQRHTSDEELDLLAPDADPELAYLKKLYASEVRNALAGAMAALAPRDRNLLRQHFLDGLNIDAIGKLYRVHRATAARWIVDVREKLLEDVRTRLSAHLSRETAFESVLRMARSDLDLSISRLLRRTD